MANALVQLAFEHNLRAEQIIHLGTMACCDPLADVAREAFEDDWSEIWACLGVAEPELTTDEGISNYLVDCNIGGFLVQVGTPVPNGFGRLGSYCYSWGNYHCQWFYGDILEQVFEKAAKYQTEYIERKQAEAERKEATPC